MKKILLIAVLVLGTFVANAQTKEKNVRLVADETTLTELKSSIKVQTSNETVFKMLITKYRSNITRYTVEFKKDRKGDYTQYTFPFKKEQLPEVEEFLTNL